MLEDMFTAKAAGSVERLLDSLPSQATRVKVKVNEVKVNGANGSGVPVMSSAEAVKASALEKGEHVLVRPGEQVSLEGGVWVWGVCGWL